MDNESPTGLIAQWGIFFGYSLFCLTKEILTVEVEIVKCVYCENMQFLKGKVHKCFVCAITFLIGGFLGEFATIFANKLLFPVSTAGLSIIIPMI